MARKVLTRVLESINRKSHSTGDFRLKNVIMNFALLTKAIKSRITTVSLIYQTQAVCKWHEKKAIFNHYKDDLYYYDLFEILDHHLPVPLAWRWVIKLFNLDNVDLVFTTSYFDTKYEDEDYY